MPRTVAIMVVKTTKYLEWLGDKPMMCWSLEQLREVRGIDRIVCVTPASLASQIAKLVPEDSVDLVHLPKDLRDAGPDMLDKWFTSATGPASDADIVVVSKCSSPFLPSGRIEACVTAVRRRKCTHAQPSRAVLIAGVRKLKSQEAVDSVRVYRVNVPVEQVTVKAFDVDIIESLDVERPDEFVIADALVLANKI